MSDFVTVGRKDVLKPGECRVVETRGRLVALYNVGGRFYATDNRCLHKGGPLGDGELSGEVVVCPWHQWAFNVVTGKSTTNPSVRLACYEVRVLGEEIQILL